MDVVQHTFQPPLNVPPVPSTIKIHQQQQQHSLNVSPAPSSVKVQQQQQQPQQQNQQQQQQQQSVIQSNQQLQQQLQSMHDGEDQNGHRRREILTRRPSYRKILDDLASDGPVKLETFDETGSSDASSPTTEENTVLNSGIPQVNKEQYQSIQLKNSVLNNSGVNISQVNKEYQSIQLINSVAPTASSANTVVQLSPQGLSENTSSGESTQYIITTQGPGNKIQAYTIKGQLPVGLDTTTIASPQQLAEEASRKRELRLYKNREAARECRRKKKEYVKCLENRVAVLENQNKALIEELKSLKDLYCSKGD